MRPFNRKLNLKRVFISLFAAMFKSSSPNSNQMKPAITSGVCFIFPNNPHIADANFAWQKRQQMDCQDVQPVDQ